MGMKKKTAFLIKNWFADLKIIYLEIIPKGFAKIYSIIQLLSSGESCNP